MKMLQGCCFLNINNKLVRRMQLEKHRLDEAGAGGDLRRGLVMVNTHVLFT